VPFVRPGADGNAKEAAFIEVVERRDQIRVCKSATEFLYEAMSASAATACRGEAFWPGITGNLRVNRLGGLRASDVLTY